MVKLHNGKAPQYAGPQQQSSSQIIRKKKAPDVPETTSPPPSVYSVSPSTSPSLQRRPAPSPPTSRDISPLRRNNVLLEGPVFVNQRYKRRGETNNIHTLHPPARNNNGENENDSNVEEPVLSSATSSRRPSLRSFVSYASTTASSLQRRQKRKAPLPPNPALTVPEEETTQPTSSPPPPPPLPPVLFGRPPEPPIDYDDQPAVAPKLLPPRAMSLPASKPPAKPARQHRLLPEPEPNLWDLMKFELSKAVAAREQRAPVIKDPERAKFQPVRRFSQELTEELKQAYGSRERRRSQFVLRMREGGRGLRRFYKAQLPDDTIVEVSDLEDDDIETQSSSDSLEMVEWVPADDLDEDFLQDHPESTLTSRGKNIPIYFHNFTDGNTTNNQSPQKWNGLKKTMSSMIGNLSKTLGRRAKVKNLLNEGWEIYHSPQRDTMPEGDVKVSRIEKRSAYAYHPHKDKLMMIPNYDRVVVTEDGERIRESAVPKEQRPTTEEEERIQVKPYDIVIRGRLMERERQRIQMAEREFVAVRQQKRHFSEGDVNIPITPILEKAANEAYLQEKIRISETTKPSSFKKHDLLMAELEGHAYSLKRMSKKLGKPRKAKSLSRLSFADFQRRRNPIYSSDDEDSDTMKSPSTPVPTPQQPVFPMPIYGMPQMYPIYPGMPIPGYPGYAWGPYPAGTVPVPGAQPGAMPATLPGTAPVHNWPQQPMMIPYLIPQPPPPPPPTTLASTETNDNEKPYNESVQTENGNTAPEDPPALIPVMPDTAAPTKPEEEKLPEEPSAPSSSDPPLSSPPLSSLSPSSADPSPSPSPVPPPAPELSAEEVSNLSPSAATAASPPAEATPPVSRPVSSTPSSPKPVSSTPPSPKPASSTPSSPKPGAFLCLSSKPRPWSPSSDVECEDEKERRTRLLIGPRGFRPVNFNPDVKSKPVM